MIVTALISVGLLIVATSKLWFSHLWKKNSSHKRHSQHSPHHPVNRYRENDEQPAIPASRSSGRKRHRTSRHRRN
jgi:hypothetical protein